MNERIYRPLIPSLIGVATFAVYAYLATLHPFGTYGTETDFYLYFAPDAERITRGEFPQSTFHGPGYALLLAGAAAFTNDLFIAAKSIAVVAATAVVLLTFVLFARVFSYWTGVAASLLVAVAGRLPEYAISATTDVVFLAFSLAALVAFTSRGSDRLRIAGAAIFTGFAYLTRYNAISLVAALLFALVVLDLFERPLKPRLALGAGFLLVFTIVIAPWLIANARHRGSPFFNTNYLNVGKTLHPSVAAGYAGEDGLRRASGVFHSLGDVVRYDRGAAATNYVRNVIAHVTTTFGPAVAGPVVPWLALLGAMFALFAIRWRSSLLLLVAAATHYLIIGLVHWEARFHFFMTVLFAGFAAHALASVF
ncbi:MAG TPA: glycosyltransferase family 39 protein, partial [Thermoanaerobaculia bacterium]